MAMYTSLHMDPAEPCEITCEHQLNALHPEGYPVLAIGALTIYPTRERLERLRAVIDAYLAAHGDKADGPQVGYPSDVRCDRCGNPTVAFKGHLRCFGCGNSMPLPPDGSADRADIMPIPAEASTGAVVDADELLTSMASEWGSPTVEELEAAGRNRPAGVP